MYSYLCNQCPSSLMLWVRISIRARCATLCDKVCQWLATYRWFSRSPSVSSNNKTDRHDIAEILLKVALNTMIQTNKQTNQMCINNVTDFKFQHIILTSKFKYLPSINNSDFFCSASSASLFESEIRSSDDNTLLIVHCNK